MNKPLETSSTFGQVSPTEPERQLRVGEFDKRQLEPYQDIDFFKRRIFGPSRILRRNPELISFIGDAFVADDDDQLQKVVELIEISREIDAPTNETVFNKMLSTVTLQSQLADIHKERCGDDETALGIVTLIEQMYRRIGNEVADQELEAYKSSSEFIVQQMSKIPRDQSAEGQKCWWMKRRLIAFDHIMDERIAALRYVLDLPKTDSEAVTDEQVAADSEEIASLFTQAHDKQSYGVKLSYKSQQYRRGSLVFKENETIESVYEDARGEDNSYIRMHRDLQKEALCIVIDSPKKSYREGLQYQVVGNPSSEDVDIKTNITARFAFEVHADGSVRSTIGEVDDILVEAAARYGRYNSYRSLQAEIIADYLDLTNPVEVTNSVTRSPEMKNAAQAARNRDNDDNSIGMDIVRTLMIPRIKAKRNAEEGNTPSNEIGREVRLHGVVWHIRHLPEGWHASAQAREIATEAGVVLGSSETFVKAHKRGSARMGEVVAHELIRRR